MLWNRPGTATETVKVSRTLPSCRRKNYRLENKLQNRAYYVDLSPEKQGNWEGSSHASQEQIPAGDDFS